MAKYPASICQYHSSLWCMYVGLLWFQTPNVMCWLHATKLCIELENISNYNIKIIHFVMECVAVEICAYQPINWMLLHFFICILNFAQLLLVWPSGKDLSGSLYSSFRFALSHSSHWFKWLPAVLSLVCTANNSLMVLIQTLRNKIVRRSKSKNESKEPKC